MEVISAKEIRLSIKTAKPHLQKLDTLYRLLPKTRCRCDQPGECCLFLPQMSWMEVLRWVDFILELPMGQRDFLFGRFLEFYLTNPARQSHCPFLNGGGCGIYDLRPFACRAYGLWSPKLGQSFTHLNRKEKKAFLDMWRRYDIDLPEAAFTYELDYCRQVTVVEGEPLSDSELMQILSQLHKLDDLQPELKYRFENGYQSDISVLIASLAWGPLKASLNKYAVIKDLVQKGSNARLIRLMAKKNELL